MADNVPIICLIGNLGAGKTSWEVARIRDLSVHSPVISSVPVVLPRPGRLFMAYDPGDIVAAAFVFSSWVFSAEAQKIAKEEKPLRRLMRSQSENQITDDEIDEKFRRMQKEYIEVANNIDWRDKISFNALIQAHDERVVSNRLDAPIGDLFEEAKAFLARDRREIASHVWGDFRFKYTPAAFPWVVFADEGGVFSSSDDLETLKKSAFLPMLAQMRKLGGQYMTSTHDPSRLLKQLREIVTLWIKVISFDLPFGLGRAYITMGFDSEAAFEGGRKMRHFSIRRVSYDTMSCYATYWIVPSIDYSDKVFRGRKRKAVEDEIKQVIEVASDQAPLDVAAPDSAVEVVKAAVVLSPESARSNGWSVSSWNG